MAQNWVGSWLGSWIGRWLGSLVGGGPVLVLPNRYFKGDSTVHRYFKGDSKVR